MLQGTNGHDASKNFESHHASEHQLQYHQIFQPPNDTHLYRFQGILIDDNDGTISDALQTQRQILIIIKTSDKNMKHLYRQYSNH